MAQNHDRQTRPQTNQVRRISRLRFPLHRRKFPTARFGGKKPPRGVTLVRMLRKVRLRWLKLKYMCMLKKLKESYKKIVKELTEGGVSFETFQRTTFAIPMGGSLSSCPSVSGSDRRPRTLFIM